MLQPGDIVSYIQMCIEEDGTHLQRGMNFRMKGRDYSIILMSQQENAPYVDSVLDDGRTLIYEGHDVRAGQKQVDQSLFLPGGKLSQNGLFMETALKHKQKQQAPERVRVYEKMRPGIWVFNGVFTLVDGWQEHDGERHVFKFKLVSQDNAQVDVIPPEHSRFIPSVVKQEVWKRDQGRCVVCGSTDNLHFDHVIPFSKGGTSLKAENIQLMCAKHNYAKQDKVE